jgi:hypothetical protein
LYPLDSWTLLSICIYIYTHMFCSTLA